MRPPAPPSVWPKRRAPSRYDGALVCKCSCTTTSSRVRQPPGVVPPCAARAPGPRETREKKKKKNTRRWQREIHPSLPVQNFFLFFWDSPGSKYTLTDVLTPLQHLVHDSQTQRVVIHHEHSKPRRERRSGRGRRHDAPTRDNTGDPRLFFVFFPSPLCFAISRSHFSSNGLSPPQLSNRMFVRCRLFFSLAPFFFQPRRASVAPHTILRAQQPRREGNSTFAPGRVISRYAAPSVSAPRFDVRDSRARFFSRPDTALAKKRKKKHAFLFFSIIFSLFFWKQKPG